MLCNFLRSFRRIVSETKKFILRKKCMAKKINESEYAAVVVKHFENLGYEVFKEVGFGGGSMRADIYCRKGDETIAIEVKTSLNLKVLDQAFGWREHANKVYFAVPSRSHQRFAVTRAICEAFGIGMLDIYLYSHHRVNSEVRERIPACINSEPKHPPLYEQQKDSIAGTHSGNFVTPFKITCIRLLDHVTANGPVLLVDAMRSIEHHYSNENSAVAGIRKMIKWGVITEMEIFKDKNKNYIRLKDPV